MNPQRTRLSEAGHTGLSRYTCGSAPPSNSNALTVRKGAVAFTAIDQAFRVSRPPSGHDIIYSTSDYDRVTGAVELTRLPGWPDIAATNMVLQLSQSRQDTIKVVLDKAEKTWYSTLNSLHNHLLAVIQRELPL